MKDTRQPTYVRASVVSLDEVLPLIPTSGKRVLVGGEMVKAESLRMRTFKEKGQVCVACGLSATHFAIERHNHETVFHINMYGVDAEGDEVLFTHDHVIPKSKGGADNISNTATMCGPCNWTKGSGTTEKPENHAPVCAKRVITVKGMKVVTVADSNPKLMLTLFPKRNEMRVRLPANFDNQSTDYVMQAVNQFIVEHGDTVVKCTHRGEIRYTAGQRAAIKVRTERHDSELATVF